MHIRPWTEQDQDAIEDLLHRTWEEHPDVLDLLSIHGSASDTAGAFRRSFVAEQAGALTGVGTIREYWLHPSRLRFAITVDPALRRVGCGRALFKTLLDAIPAGDDRELQCATTNTDADGLRFLKAMGFRQLMQTRIGTLDPADISATFSDRTRAAVSEVEGRGLRLSTLRDIGPDFATRQALARLHADVYRASHGWNPPATISDDVAADLFLAEDDLIPDALFVALADQQPVAVASLRPGEMADVVELGWAGVAASHQGQAEALALALIGRCLSYAEQHQQIVSIEIDEADTFVRPLAADLPVRASYDWLTLVAPRLGKTAERNVTG